MPEIRDLDCNEVVELVTDYLEGALPPDEHAAFEAHLAICSGCAAYVDQIRATIALSRRPREEDLAPEAREALVRAFRSWRGAGEATEPAG